MQRGVNQLVENCQLVLTLKRVNWRTEAQVHHVHGVHGISMAHMAQQAMGDQYVYSYSTLLVLYE